MKIEDKFPFQGPMFNLYSVGLNKDRYQFANKVKKYDGKVWQQGREIGSAFFDQVAEVFQELWELILI